MLCGRMPWWVIVAGLGSIAITALLTALLWRMNAPLRERGAQSEGGGPGSEHHRRDADGTIDGGSDGGGGD